LLDKVSTCSLPKAPTMIMTRNWVYLLGGYPVEWAGEDGDSEEEEASLRIGASVDRNDTWGHSKETEDVPKERCKSLTGR